MSQQYNEREREPASLYVLCSTRKKVIDVAIGVTLSRKTGEKKRKRRRRKRKRRRRMER